MRAFLVIIFLLVPLPTLADCGGVEGATLCSKTFHGAGLCTGLDQLPIYSEPWEDRPIEIVGVTVGLQLWGGEKQQGYIFAGNSYVPDVMAFHIGAGSQAVMFPAGLSFSLPAKGAPGNPHIDTHVACSGSVNYTAWMIVFYTAR